MVLKEQRKSEGWIRGLDSRGGTGLGDQSGGTVGCDCSHSSSSSTWVSSEPESGLKNTNCLVKDRQRSSWRGEAAVHILVLR